MAKVSIEGGTVIRIIEGYGFVVATERKSKDGEIYKDYFTIWTKDKIAEGEVISLRGDLSVRTEEYTNREGKVITKAVAHINNPEIKKEEAPF